MSAADNKALMMQIFDDLSKGDSRSFNAALAPDFAWVITGHNSWSGRYGGGMDKIREDLIGPLYAQFASRYISRATRFIADDDVVIVETRGDVTTTKGKHYNNEYCLIYVFRDGKIIEQIEYMDSAFCEATLGTFADVMATYKQAA